MDQRVDQALAPEPPARQQPGNGDAGNQAGGGGGDGDQQAQPDGRPFLCRHVELADFTRTVNPCFSKADRALLPFSMSRKALASADFDSLLFSARWMIGGWESPGYSPTILTF